MKNITLIFLLLFLTACGYSSIYKNQKSIDFKINFQSEEGNDEMNNLIKNEIRLYSNKDSKNIYNLKIKFLQRIRLESLQIIIFLLSQNFQ